MDDTDMYFSDSLREGNTESFFTQHTSELNTTGEYVNTEETQPPFDPEIDEEEEREPARPPLFDEEEDMDFPGETKEAQEANADEEEKDYDEKDYEDEEDELGQLFGDDDDEDQERSRLKRKRSEEYNEEDGEYDPNQLEEDPGQLNEEYEAKAPQEQNLPPIELTEDEALEKQFEDEVLSAVKREKSTMYRKRRRKNTEMDTAVENYNNYIATLAERMNEARREDDADIKAGRIALAKLKLLDEVVRGMQLRNPAEDIHLDKDDHDRPPISADFLVALSKWLKPLATGALPTLKIREAILKNLDRLTVSTEGLAKSELGKVIMMLSKSKKELEVNRRICKQLISKWIRPIFGISANYSQEQEEGMPQQQQQQQQQQRLPPRQPVRRPAPQARSVEDPFDVAGGDEGERPFYFPTKSSMDFVRKPRGMESQGMQQPKAVRDKEHMFNQAFQATTRASRGGSRSSSLGLVRMPRAMDKK